jgi:hypothetical protein
VGNAVSGAIIRTVASEGRKFGMGLVIVSQRPAKIDKNVLSQCNTQVVLKVTNPNDLKAIVQSVEGISAALADEIQRLAVGEALVAGGGLTQPVFVSVRPRLTRHGGRSVSVLHQDADEDDEEDGPEAEDGTARPAWPPAATGPASSPPIPEAAWPAAPPAPPAPAWAPTVPPPMPPRQEAAPEPLRAPPARAVRAPAAQRPAEPVAFQALPRPRRLVSDDAYLAPKSRPSWSAGDARSIHRVAARIGLVGPDQDPARTVAIVADLESSHHRDPDERLRLLLEIAENACLPDEPACIRCPEQATCAFHRLLQQERQKTRSPLRRLWR